MLGHLISELGIEVDKAKVQVIEKLPPPTSVKGVRSFLGHVGFYHHFVKDFSKIARPLTVILATDVQFCFDKDCMVVFQQLKKDLISSLIMQPSNWTLPFELMCDVSDCAIGIILGRHKDKKLYTIYYANRTLDNVQANYATTE